MALETIEQYKTLQRFDSRIHAIEITLAKIPEMLKESLSKFETLIKDKTDAQSEYDKCREELLRVESTTAEHKNLLASAQKKLTSVHNNKEYEAALKELDSLKKSIADGEANAKTISAKIAELDGVIKSKSEESATSEAEYLKEKEEKESENSSLFEELAKLKEEREKFAATVKKSALSKYDRIRLARQNLAIVSIDGETYTGCSMKLPPQQAVEVKKMKELLTCPHCQRFLYYEKPEVAE